MGAVFAAGPDITRAVDLVAAAACGKIAANRGRHRTATIDAACKLFGPRADQAPDAPVPGIQVAENESDLSAGPR